MVYLVIKGAIYTNGDCLLRPHYSGFFSLVDCTRYLKKSEIKERYSIRDAKRFIGEDGMYLEYNGEKYYECEYDSYGTEKMECLSDLSSLNYFDDNQSF